MLMSAAPSPQSPSPPASPSDNTAPTSTLLTSSPGPRATALTKIYHSALTSTLKSNSYPNFAACFPTPARYCPSALEGVWKQLNERLREECERDFERILEERDVVRGLNEWDEILERARRKKDRSVDLPGERRDDDHMEVDGEGGRKPLHLLSAREMYDGFLSGYLVKTYQETEMKLKKTQDQNKEVMAEVRTQREEIQRLMGGLEAAAKEIEAAVKVLEEYEKEDHSGKGLRGEIWDIEKEVAATKDGG